ncbi:LOW QUALITY PROTEIN: protein PLANT CADMIUM RESISTANCE 8 [Hevea brasiliensis]|uniref:LOW QUALITY PROTEIN: protein PLANT CADMIUM RESISTANCE 8 n=1 Tax=Hevea brasiliensis TaxID=3981 RepID=UPI0025D69CD2|nr:LOW QUALITY PROTEIN: protein PLANT CADMIUM RESISTANCE 8 [Hevea brasiliensis]
MGRPETCQIDRKSQQSAPQPAEVAPQTWHQVQDNIQPGILHQGYSTTAPVVLGNNMVLGHPWTTGLFDCHEYQTNAIMTAFFPCVTFGQIVEVLDERELTCPLGSFIYVIMMPTLCFQWIMGSKYRAKLLRIYNLVEAPYTDVISHFFCPFCSLCQEFRELRNRGLDPALGWNGILAQRQGRQYHNVQVNVPPQDQVMSR